MVELSEVIILLQSEQITKREQGRESCMKYLLQQLPKGVNHVSITRYDSFKLLNALIQYESNEIKYKQSKSKPCQLNSAQLVRKAIQFLKHCGTFSLTNHNIFYHTLGILYNDYIQKDYKETYKQILIDLMDIRICRVIIIMENEISTVFKNIWVYLQEVFQPEKLSFIDINDIRILKNFCNSLFSDKNIHVLRDFFQWFNHLIQSVTVQSNHTINEQELMIVILECCHNLFKHHDLNVFMTIFDILQPIIQLSIRCITSSLQLRMDSEKVAPAYRIIDTLYRLSIANHFHSHAQLFQSDIIKQHIHELHDIICTEKNYLSLIHHHRNYVDNEKKKLNRKDGNKFYCPLDEFKYKIQLDVIGKTLYYANCNAVEGMVVHDKDGLWSNHRQLHGQTDQVEDFFNFLAKCVNEKLGIQSKQQHYSSSIVPLAISASTKSINPNHVLPIESILEGYLYVLTSICKSFPDGSFFDAKMTSNCGHPPISTYQDAFSSSTSVSNFQTKYSNTTKDRHQVVVQYVGLLVRLIIGLTYKGTNIKTDDSLLGATLITIQAICLMSSKLRDQLRLEVGLENPIHKQLSTIWFKMLTTLLQSRTFHRLTRWGPIAEMYLNLISSILTLELLNHEQKSEISSAVWQLPIWFQIPPALIDDGSTSPSWFRVVSTCLVQFKHTVPWNTFQNLFDSINGAPLDSNHREVLALIQSSQHGLVTRFQWFISSWTKDQLSFYQVSDSLSSGDHKLKRINSEYSTRTSLEPSTQLINDMASQSKAKKIDATSVQSTTNPVNIYRVHEIMLEMMRSVECGYVLSSHHGGFDKQSSSSQFVVRFTNAINRNKSWYNPLHWTLLPSQIGQSMTKLLVDFGCGSDFVSICNLKSMLGTKEKVFSEIGFQSKHSFDQIECFSNHIKISNSESNDMIDSRFNTNQCKMVMEYATTFLKYLNITKDRLMFIAGSEDKTDENISPDQELFINEDLESISNWYLVSVVVLTQHWSLFNALITQLNRSKLNPSDPVESSQVKDAYHLLLTILTNSLGLLHENLTQIHRKLVHIKPHHLHYYFTVLSCLLLSSSDLLHSKGHLLVKAIQPKLVEEYHASDKKCLNVLHAILLSLQTMTVSTDTNVPSDMHPNELATISDYYDEFDVTMNKSVTSSAPTSSIKSSIKKSNIVTATKPKGSRTSKVDFDDEDDTDVNDLSTFRIKLTEAEKMRQSVSVTEPKRKRLQSSHDTKRMRGSNIRKHLSYSLDSNDVDAETGSMTFTSDIFTNSSSNIEDDIQIEDNFSPDEDHLEESRMVSSYSHELLSVFGAVSACIVALCEIKIYVVSLKTIHVDDTRNDRILGSKKIEEALEGNLSQPVLYTEESMSICNDILSVFRGSPSKVSQFQFLSIKRESSIGKAVDGLLLTTETWLNFADYLSTILSVSCIPVIHEILTFGGGESQIQSIPIPIMYAEWGALAYCKVLTIIYQIFCMDTFWTVINQQSEETRQPSRFHKIFDDFVNLVLCKTIGFHKIIRLYAGKLSEIRILQIECVSRVMKCYQKGIQSIKDAVIEMFLNGFADSDYRVRLSVVNNLPFLLKHFTKSLKVYSALFNGTSLSKLFIPVSVSDESESKKMIELSKDPLLVWTTALGICQMGTSNPILTPSALVDLILLCRSRDPGVNYFLETSFASVLEIQKSRKDNTISLDSDNNFRYFLNYSQLLHQMLQHMGKNMNYHPLLAAKSILIDYLPFTIIKCFKVSDQLEEEKVNTGYSINPLTILRMFPFEIIFYDYDTNWVGNTSLNFVIKLYRQFFTQYNSMVIPLLFHNADEDAIIRSWTRNSLLQQIVQLCYPNLKDTQWNSTSDTIKALLKLNIVSIEASLVMQKVYGKESVLSESSGNSNGINQYFTNDELEDIINIRIPDIVRNILLNYVMVDVLNLMELEEDADPHSLGTDETNLNQTEVEDLLLSVTTLVKSSKQVNNREQRIKELLKICNVNELIAELRSRLLQTRIVSVGRRILSCVLTIIRHSEDVRTKGTYNGMIALLNASLDTIPSMFPSSLEVLREVIQSACCLRPTRPSILAVVGELMPDLLCLRYVIHYKMNSEAEDHDRVIPFLQDQHESFLRCKLSLDVLIQSSQVIEDCLAKLLSFCIDHQEDLVQHSMITSCLPCPSDLRLHRFGSSKVNTLLSQMERQYPINSLVEKLDSYIASVRIILPGEPISCFSIWFQIRIIYQDILDRFVHSSAMNISNRKTLNSNSSEACIDSFQFSWKGPNAEQIAEFISSLFALNQHSFHDMKTLSTQWSQEMSSIATHLMGLLGPPDPFSISHTQFPFRFRDSIRESNYSIDQMEQHIIQILYGMLWRSPSEYRAASVALRTLQRSNFFEKFPGESNKAASNLNQASNQTTTYWSDILTEYSRESNEENESNVECCHCSLQNEEENIWELDHWKCPGDFEYNDWICQLTSRLIGTCYSSQHSHLVKSEDTVGKNLLISTLRNACQLNHAMAEHVFPLLILDLIGSDEQDRKDQAGHSQLITTLSANISKGMLLIQDTTQNNVDPLPPSSLAATRLACRTLSFLLRNDIRNFIGQSKLKSSQPKGQSTLSGRSTSLQKIRDKNQSALHSKNKIIDNATASHSKQLWDIPFKFGLQIDYFAAAEAAMKCHLICTALQFIEFGHEATQDKIWGDSNKSNHDAPTISFSNSKLLNGLVTIYRKLHDPDSIDAMTRVPYIGSDLTMQAILYGHQGQWMEALAAYESLSQGGHFQSSESDHTSPTLGILHALRGLGANHTLLHYTKSLRQSSISSNATMIMGYEGDESKLQNMEIEASWKYGMNLQRFQKHHDVLDRDLVASKQLQQWTFPSEPFHEEPLSSSSTSQTFLHQSTASLLQNISKPNLIDAQMISEPCQHFLYDRCIEKIGNETVYGIMEDMSHAQLLIELKETFEILDLSHCTSELASKDEAKWLLSKWEDRCKSGRGEIHYMTSSLAIRLNLIEQILQKGFITTWQAMKTVNVLLDPLLQNKDTTLSISPLVYRFRNAILSQSTNAVDKALAGNEELSDGYWTFCESKMLWRKGLKDLAISNISTKLIVPLMQQSSDKGLTSKQSSSRKDDMKNLISEACRLCGDWVSSKGAASSTHILKQYLEPSVQYAVNTQQKVASSTTLGLFYVRMHESLKSKVNSVEWSQGGTLIHDRKHELDQCVTIFNEKKDQKSKEMSKNSGKDQPSNGMLDEELKNLHRHIVMLMKENEIDKKERQTVESSVQMYLIQGLEQLCSVLEVSFDQDTEIVFRLINLWFSNSDEAGVNHLIDDMLEQVPSYKLIPLTYQIFSRLGQELMDNKGGVHGKGMETKRLFGEVVSKMVRKLCYDHPFHTLPQLFALAHNHQPPSLSRATAAQDIVKLLKQSNQRELIESTEQLFLAYIDLANVTTKAFEEPGRSKIIKYRDIQPRGKRFNECIKAITSSSSLSEQKQIHLPAVITISHELRPMKDYRDVVRIHSFNETFQITEHGISRPKIITCMGLDGKEYKQLVKSGDDMRQDAVMEQVFENINCLLNRDDQTKKRKLSLRTYKIIPTTPQTGILEWVQNTSPYGAILTGASKELGIHERYYPNDWSHSDCRNCLKDATDNHDKLKRFTEICDHFHPAFRFFFLELYQDPTQWVSGRLAYTRSVATTSIAGYILGIGDRHAHNILIDTITSEVVHIDFGIVYEQGKILQTPETIPFRLTRDIVDGMGVTGVEGTFRRSCEEVLRVLRDNAFQIMTILEVVMHDPLYKWSLSPLQARKKQQQEIPTALTRHPVVAISEDTTNIGKDAAGRTLRRIHNKLLGQEDSSGEALGIVGHVDILIHEAQDQTNLCKIFPGWSPWM